jgi:hypothetical protein
MPETIALTTDFDRNYWELHKPARFPSTDINKRLSSWRQLNSKCPLPAIGLYTDKYKERHFDYIIIKDIIADADGTPNFDYEFISNGHRESRILDEKINLNRKKFYFSIDCSTLIQSLRDIEEKPPLNWLNLFENNTPIVNTEVIVTEKADWSAYLGRYFLDLRDRQLGNEEFENRVAFLLTALGFKVLQKGHLLVGTVPDGVATYSGDIGLVYDCKNSSNYSPNANDMRALESYYNDERAKHRDLQMFPCFIAKKGITPIVGDKLVIYVEALLYVLFKKLASGSDFKLDPIINFFTNKRVFSIENINIYWD